MKKEKLGNLISLQRGYDLPASKMKRGPYPVAGSNGIIGFHNTAKAQAPCITIGRSGSVGKIHFYNRPIWPHNTSLYVTDFKGNNPRYIYYLLSLIDFTCVCGNSVVPSLNRNFVYPIEVPFFEDRKEQNRIENVLTLLDKKINLKRLENNLLENMTKQLYDYWFVQFDFPDANGNPYKSSGGKMVWNEKLKREIPEGWEVKALSEICDIVNGATPSTANKNNYGGDIIWITPKDLSDQKNKFIFKGERNITQTGYDSCSTTLVPRGSILMSSRAPIGLLSIASNNLCTNQGFKTFVPLEMDNNLFVYYYVKRHMKQIEQLGSGTTFKEVSRDDLKNFPIIYVSNRVVYSIWHEKVLKIFRRQELLQEEITELTNLRDFLLPLLMNGQVTIKE